MSEGSSSFLIKDQELLNGFSSPFVIYLNNEGFKNWKNHGYFDRVDWIYVNMNNMRYAFGLPGIPITTPVGNHAITIKEFITIYNIYKKYNDKRPLEM